MTVIRSRRPVVAAALLFALFATPFLVAPRIAEAHERRAVGGYEFVVGWIVEPSYEGQKNGVDLRITKGGQPLVDAEKTLKLEVTHVDSNMTKPFTLRTIFNAPGAYTADLVPTAGGVYKFRFTGNLEGTNIDQTFTAGPGTFGLIEPMTAIQFPQALADQRQVEGAARGASDAAAAATAAAKSAEAAASSARMLAIAGVALGAAGIAFGVMAMRKR